MADEIFIGSENFVTELTRRSVACAHVTPGQTLRFETSDIPYRDITGDGIDAGLVDFRTINRMSGPISIEGATPGDALGFTIDHIEIGDAVHVVMNARWRARGFSLSRSSVDHYPVEDNRAIIGETLRIPVRPMVGCIATAPSRGVLSSLSPCRSTGGNLDLWQIGPGVTVWLPVRVEGALLALGDVHASMGAGEPVGCGLECGGGVRGRVSLVKGFELPGLRIETPEAILFVGSAHDSLAEAQNKATLAAWNWLTFECGIETTDALAVSAALLHLEYGGPAGANILAGFPLQALRESGITPRLLSGEVTEPPNGR